MQRQLLAHAAFYDLICSPFSQPASVSVEFFGFIISFCIYYHHGTANGIGRERNGNWTG